MTTARYSRSNYFKAVFDHLPTSLLVVNHDFTIYDVNPAARELFGIAPGVDLNHLCGHIMHCLHAIESTNGCGTTVFCPDCVIRNAVERSSRGKFIKRHKYTMKIQPGPDVTELTMLVSTAPLDYGEERLVLLTIEDITEVDALRRLLPICSNCNKIRNDEQYWESVSEYFQKHAGFKFTHSYCPECAQKLYPDLYSEQSRS